MFDRILDWAWTVAAPPISSDASQSDDAWAIPEHSSVERSDAIRLMLLKMFLSTLE